MASKRNVVLGEVSVGMGAGAIQAGSANVDRIVAEAEAVWRKARVARRRAGAAPGKEMESAASEALLARLRRAHRDLASSFPVPFRWTVQTGDFDSGVFREYLARHAKGMYPTRRKFLEAQGEYLVMLFRKRNKRAGPKAIAEYRTAVVKNLVDDDEKFARANEEAKAEAEATQADAVAHRRARLRAHFERLRAEAAAPAS